jgi:hypothetical protein
MTNVVPLLGRADTISSEELSVCKAQVVSELRNAGIRPFTFAASVEMTAKAPGALIPYAISSASGSDHDTMDASLLMSPDYVQPLIPTELAVLVDQVFSSNGVAWLRHAAARKVVSWKNSSNPSRPQALYRPLSLPVTGGHDSPPGLGALVSTSSRPTSFALAKVTDHTQREERLAQIRLANWAADLQRSLANERARYDALAQSERALWLTERLNECVQDGTLVPMSVRSNSQSPSRKLVSKGRASTRTAKHQDPLGLLEVAADLKTKGWLALEVLGGLGVLGGLALWVTRNYPAMPEWVAAEWTKFWGGDR